MGTGISRKEKLRKENYKIVFKVRISSPLQTYLVDSSDRIETRPRRPRIQFEKFNLQDVPVPNSS